MTLNPALNSSIALAWQLLQAGNVAAAEKLVQPLLASGVADELTPLVGAIRLEQGRFAEAAVLFERARALSPREARFAFLHGRALASLGQYQQAVPAYQSAIKQEPGVAAAYLGLGEAQQKQGLLDDAQNTYRKLLRLQPGNVEGYIALGAALAEAGQPAEAEAALRRALQQTTDKTVQAVLYNNLAFLLGSQEKHAEALESLDQAGRLAPALPNLDNRRIDVLHKLGRFDDCVSLYQKLLARDPADPQMHHAYNSLLYRLGRMEEYLASYDRAPQTRDILLGKAGMLSLQKRGAEAHEIYSALMSRDPHDLAAAAGAAGALLAMGRHGESAAAFEALAKRPDTGAQFFSRAAEAALLNGDPQKAEAFCQAGLEQQPHDQTCLALLGTAWRWQEDERDEGLNGYDTLIRSFDLEAPEGFSNMADFNAELGAWLETQHPKTREYLEQTLRGGTQTEGYLFGSGQALVERLKARIDETLTRYIAEMAADERHPFLSRRTQGFTYAGAWSSLMREQGFHVNHLHPQGWISSCYYVTVPEVARDEDTKQGWIKFGEPSLDVPLKNAVRRAIQPVPGRLVLFPSYMWHGTVPFREAALRTTIAFDAIPEA